MPVIDKIAIVFHGIVGGACGRNGVGETINVSDCAKTIKYNVLSLYDCDIFMHSWSIKQKDILLSLYNPIKFSFQPQEMFGHIDNIEINSSQHAGQAFRVISRYSSLERAMSLKQKHEYINGFRYKWVLVLRFDLVFFTKLNLNDFDSNYFYVCSEPYWQDLGIKDKIHDIVFLSDSIKIDEYGLLASEIRLGQYSHVLGDSHVMVYQKLMKMFNGDINKIKFGFRRYWDIEIYRMVINPELNHPSGHAYGSLETKNRFEKLLNEIKDI